MTRRTEPVVQRVRARFGKHPLLDTTDARLFFEDHRRPWRAIPRDALRATLAGPATPDPIDGRWWAIELDGIRRDHAVRAWDQPPADCPELAGLLVLDPDAADQWLEEEHPVPGAPRNPYHRVDVLPSARHIEILVNGAPLADTRRPTLVIETGLPPRWYVPPGDLRWDRAPPRPTAHHLPVQGHRALLERRGHRPDPGGVELPGTARGGRSSGRTDQHHARGPSGGTACRSRSASGGPLGMTATTA